MGSTFITFRMEFFTIEMIHDSYIFPIVDYIKIYQR